MVRPVSEAPEIPTLMEADVDLHAVFREARAKAPVGRNIMGMPIALKGRQIDAVLSDATRQLETETLMMQGVNDGPLWDLRTNSILFSNGDAHRRRRQPLAKTFAFKLMEGMRPRAREVATVLVQNHLGAGKTDFLNDVSGAIPASIIADILGIPRSDLPYFRSLVEKVVQTIGFFDVSRRAEYEAVVVEFDQYVGKLLDDRRKRPNGDWLSEFAAAADAAKEMSDAEIRADVMALITAGSDTTKNTVAMTLALLLNNPSEWKKLVADPDGMKKGAAAEGLRYEPVAIGVPRMSVAPFDLDGYEVPPGLLCIFSIVSACRDPDIYANPDTFDISRTDHPRWHFAFGGGAHRCLGEALARVEIEEALAAIAHLAPKAEPVGPMPKMANRPIRAVDQTQVILA